MTDELPPLDLTHLTDIAGDDPEFIQELLAVFLADAERLMGLIQGAYTYKDTTQLKKYSHQLKGSSGNVGAGALRQLATQLEDGLLPLPPLVAQLPLEITRIRAYLAAPSSLPLGD